MNKMVKLNVRLILQGISTVNFDKRDLAEAEKQFHRVTHLHLQNKKITKLTNLDKFTNLTVLYLYENQISHIKGLYGAINLEILYLQKNHLDRVNGLTECTKLQKLFLGYNAIQCLDGLDALIDLEELHVEYQRLKPSDHLMIDPMSLDTLSTCLRVLDISGNHIDTLEDLAGMQIRTLIARDNRLVDIDKTILIISTLPNLHTLDLRENPITKMKKYREKIIGYSAVLELLDDKVVSDCSRNFMQNFCRMKAARLKQVVDSYGELPNSSMTGSMKTMGGANNFISQNQQQRQSSFLNFRNSKMPKGISSAMFKNQLDLDLETNYTELHDDSKMQLKSQSLQLLFPPKLIKPEDMSIPQFVLAPPNFHNEPQVDAYKNKNNNKNKNLESITNIKSIFRQRNFTRPSTGRVQDTIGEGNEESSYAVTAKTGPEPEPELMSSSLSNLKVKESDSITFLPEELTEARAYYSETIESDFPVSELSKLIHGLHENPIRAGGDTSEQGKGISWTVLSPTSSPILDIYKPALCHPQEILSLATHKEEPLSLQGARVPCPNETKPRDFLEWQQWLDFKMAGRARTTQERVAVFDQNQKLSSSESNSTFMEQSIHSKPRYIPVIPSNPYFQQLSLSEPSSSKIIYNKPSSIPTQLSSKVTEKQWQPSEYQHEKQWNSLQKIYDQNKICIIPQPSSNKMLFPIPVFQKQVYQLPPWPHIIKMGSKEPRITYMP